VKLNIKKYIIFLSFFLCTTRVECQTVDSIKTEIIGNLVRIKYCLVNSQSDQLFTIKLFCSVNGGLKFEPKSLSGDYGENIAGGRSEYAIIWDVLKDQDELTSAEFFVRAERKENSSEHIINWNNQKAYGLLAVAAGPDNLQGGFRIAYLHNWGVSLSIMGGLKKYKNVFPEKGSYYGAFTITFDGTLKLVEESNYRIHLFGGLAIANEEEPTYGRDPAEFGPEIGLIIEMRRISVFSGMSYLKFPLKQVSSLPYDTFFMSFGIGLRPR
jgi:hypothetical protein